MADQITQALPDKVAQMAAISQLGSFSQSYQAERESEAVMDSSVLIAVVLFVFSFFLYFVLNLRGGLILSLMVSSITAALVSVTRTVKASKNVVYLFQNGIIYYSQREQHTLLLWSQIASCQIRPEWLYGRLNQCMVRTTTGRRIPIGNLAGYEELGTHIKNHIGAQER